jgi:Ca2+-transporting ATPase
MQRPPRGPGEGLVGWAMLWRGLVQGGGLLAAALAAYVFLLSEGRSVDAARTVAIVALTGGNLMVVAANMSQGISWRGAFGAGFGAFWAVVCVASGVLTLGIFWPAARELLHFGVPAAGDVGMALASTAAAVAVAVAGSRWRQR